MGITAKAYVLEQPGKPLMLRERMLPDPEPGWAIVEVLGCGLCHTDLGFADGSVAPNHELPLVLGHEVVGRVIQVSDRDRLIEGGQVIVPSVLPCGDCVYCRAGRGNACLSQKMPGNDIDGGFATHISVPTGPLVPVDDAPSALDMRDLGVVADAVSTAYQATCRAELAGQHIAFVVGAGGVGIFTIQIARALGARVVAIDVSADRLELARSLGADETIEIGDMSPRDVRRIARGFAKDWDVPSIDWRIFECAGTPGAQLQAFTLVGRASTMVQVGYTPRKLEMRLSNLMAFDATIHGSWGCPPEAYSDVLGLIYRGDVQIAPLVDHAPMSSLNQQLADMADHKLCKRMVLDPTE